MNYGERLAQETETRMEREKAAQKPPATIQLAGDRVMVKPIPWEQNRMHRGILMPDTADKRELCARAEIVGIGTGFTTSDGTKLTMEELIPGLEIGARVAITRNGALEQPIRFNGEDYLILRSQDVVGVIHGE